MVMVIADSAPQSLFLGYRTERQVGTDKLHEYRQWASLVPIKRILRISHVPGIYYVGLLIMVWVRGVNCLTYNFVSQIVLRKKIWAKKVISMFPAPDDNTHAYNLQGQADYFMVAHP